MIISSHYNTNMIISFKSVQIFSSATVTYHLLMAIDVSQNIV